MFTPGSKILRSLEAQEASGGKRALSTMRCTLDSAVAAYAKTAVEGFLASWRVEFDKLPVAIKNPRFTNPDSNYLGPTVLITTYHQKPMVLTLLERTGEIDIRFPDRIDRHLDSWVGQGDQLSFRVNPLSGACSIHFTKGNLDKRWTGEIPQDVRDNPSKALSQRLSEAYYLVLSMGEHYVAKTIGA